MTRLLVNITFLFLGMIVMMAVVSWLITGEVIGTSIGNWAGGIVFALVLSVAMGLNLRRGAR